MHVQSEVKQILHTLSLKLASLEYSEGSLDDFRFSAHEAFQCISIYGLLTVLLHLLWKAYH